MRSSGTCVAVAMLAASAGAQSPPPTAGKPVAEIVADLAIGYCPMVLAGQFPFDINAQLTGLGFWATARTETVARFGVLKAVARMSPDGNIRFAGAPNKVCQVVLDGPRQDAAVAQIKRVLPGMAAMGVDFRPVPASAARLPAEVSVESFAALTGGQKLNLQIARTTTPKPALIVQMFVTGN